MAQVICQQAPMAIRTCLKCEEQSRMLEQFKACLHILHTLHTLHIYNGISSIPTQF